MNNNKLNVFRILTEKELQAEVKKLEELFPTQYPSSLGGCFQFSKRDMFNIYIGRIISLLDEFGETGQWEKYCCVSNVDKIEKNYHKLILRYVREFKPEILDYFLDYHGASFE